MFHRNISANHQAIYTRYYNKQTLLWETHCPGLYQTPISSQHHLPPPHPATTVPQAALILLVCLSRHGDMVYLVDAAPTDNGVDGMGDETMDSMRPETSQNGPSTSTNDVPSSAVEDPIDVYLAKQDGLIHRDKDPQL